MEVNGWRLLLRMGWGRLEMEEPMKREVRNNIPRLSVLGMISLSRGLEVGLEVPFAESRKGKFRLSGASIAQN